MATTTSANKDLQRAKAAKKDEFYTQLTDIENELKHYKKHFEGKTVYCNCDDPRASKFFHYFSYNFEKLKLKKLIATCYKNTNMNSFSQNDSNHSIYLEYEGDKNGNLIPDTEEIEVKHLKGDGDFRSDECIELLKEADIIVTNPPFSLFREYLYQLIEYEKNFIILGSQNAITYKEVFRLIKSGDVWLGVDNGGEKWFQVPDDYDIKTESRKRVVEGVKYFSMGSVMWFTNLDHAKRHEELILYDSYNPTDYPTYDNYNAIEVDYVKNLPRDYAGNMGVPITFLDKHNPDQFEIIGIDRVLVEELTGKVRRFLVNGKEKYARVVIRNRKLQQ